MLKQASNRIFYLPFEHAADRPNLAYVKGDRFSLLYDCGASPAHVGGLFAALDAAGLPRPALAVLSHWHWDHSFGICAMPVPVLASKKTDDKLREMRTWAWDEAAMEERLASGQEILFCHHMLHQEYTDCRSIRLRAADLVFEHEVTFDLGGVRCRLLPVGGPHSDDSVICHIPQERFVLLGDSAGRDFYGAPWQYDPAHPEDLMAQVETIPFDPVKLAHFKACLAELDFTHCLIGHEHSLTRQELMGMLG